MAHLRRTVSVSNRATCGLALLLGLALSPGVARAEPEEDEDLVLDDEEDEDEDLDEDEPSPLDDEDSGGAEASGSASVSLGSGAKASGEGSRKKGKRNKRDNKPKKKDDRPFFLRYAPTNHMLSGGIFFGGFWRGNNHGLFDRGEGPQPDIRRGNFDLGLRLSYMIIPYVGVGFETGFARTRSPSENQARGTFSSARGHLIGSLPYRLAPTLVVGGGFLGLRSNQSAILNGSDGAFHWGPGAKFYVNDWIAVRVDGRHLVTPSGNDGRNSHHGELLFGVDVTIRLTRWIGDKWRAQRTDTDGDTIADYYDECPKEYGEDEDGCPLNRDGDKDGVPDRKDKCPGEWGDGPDGCPIPDKDGDGILDIDDNCEDKPETYNGFDDQDGCPDELPEEVSKFDGVLKGIYFDTGKATIRRRSRTVLQTVVDMMSKYPSVKVEIVGHTDNQGKHDKNVKLSEDRAKSVKQFLVDKGIDGDRIVTSGRGPDEPIADNKTGKGRQKNRRIEFKIK